MARPRKQPVEESIMTEPIQPRTSEQIPGIIESDDEFGKLIGLSSYQALNPYEPTIKVHLLSDSAKMPTYANDGDLAVDLYSTDDVVLLRGHTDMVPTGIALEFESGYGAKIEEKSGLARKGLQIMGGVIDNGYRGEIMVIVHNVGESALTIKAGEKVAQLRIVPVIRGNFVQVEEISTDTERGTNGFGSTGA